MCMLAANPFVFSPAEYALIALVAGATTTAAAAWGNRAKAAFARVRAGAGRELAAA
jgi:hypothetical protein